MTPEERDAGIRADIAAGMLNDMQVARKWGVDRSTVYRKRVPRPNRGRRTFSPTVRPGDQTPPEAPTIPNHGNRRGSDISPELRQRLASYRARLLELRKRPSPAPPPMPSGPARTHVTLTNHECAHICHDLEGLGWRAEPLSMGDATAVIEVRDLSFRYTPIVAVLRTMRDVLRFEGINERCPNQGRRAGKLPYGKLPWSKNRRVQDEATEWPTTHPLPPGLEGILRRSEIDW